MFLACCVLPDKIPYGNRGYWCKYERDINGATQWLKATVPDRMVWLPAPACVIVAQGIRRARRTKRGQAISTSVRPTSTKDCTSGNETRTQNACASVRIRIASYLYTVIVPCTALYDIPTNVAYKTLSKYFIQVLTLVTPVHTTQTATTLVRITQCIHETNFKISLP